MSDINDPSLLTDQFITDLINCKKKIISSPSSKNKSNEMFKQSSFGIESDDGKYKFEIFICENTQLIEIFSVGLIYIPVHSGNVIILRYNGNHGMHKNQITKECFSGCHIHKYSEDASKKGIRAENQALQTTTYTTVKGALKALLTDINVLNIYEFFPDYQQENLFSN